MLNNVDNLLGEANSFLEVLEQASQVAPLNKPVLVIGERGTGKELIAHRLHYLSKRWQGPFISLNCAALSDTLLDSELFGHEAGAFTGAQKRHLGRFERADGGTLFLDELANAPMLVQEKLLRVIEYGQLERVGGTQPLQVDVRLVCATNEDLPAMAKAGKFRADLLDRLAFDVINLPPLRQRRPDIMLLANHFAIQMCSELEIQVFEGFTPDAVETLMGYSWPGNVRELKNVVERSIYRHGHHGGPLDNIIIDPFAHTGLAKLISTDGSADSQPHDAVPELPVNLKQWLSDREQAVIGKALRQSQYNQRQAAKLLGLSYHQLRGILRRSEPLNRQDSD
ncbi:phage shock protein operon transcriptional activator [Budvicia diplopodorum]|uniref:phage shock protein operon transcriptional activator n=1 Tax=Budvicia diplopodorum TaxID=1119056 RepID=UPI00135926DA|nr:phage shock protein operon transcriptional activator [Budvicia diplopodorum]